MEKLKLICQLRVEQATRRFCRCPLLHVKKKIEDEINLPYSFRFERFDHCTMHVIACKSVCVTYHLTSIAFTGCQNTFGAAFVVYVF